MKRISKEMLRKLANNLMLDMDEVEIEESLAEFEILLDQLDLLKEIDTETVEPMVFPFEEVTTYLREDDSTSVLTQEDVLKNAPSTYHHYFKVPKVVSENE